MARAFRPVKLEPHFIPIEHLNMAFFNKVGMLDLFLQSKTASSEFREKNAAEKLEEKRKDLLIEALHQDLRRMVKGGAIFEEDADEEHGKALQNQNYHYLVRVEDGIVLHTQESFKELAESRGKEVGFNFITIPRRTKGSSRV